MSQCRLSICTSANRDAIQEISAGNKEADATSEVSNDERIILGWLNIAAAIVLPLLGIIVAMCAWLCAGARILKRELHDKNEATTSK